MIGLATVCWATQKAHNKSCFDKKMINHPCDIIFAACAFIPHWAGLYSGELKTVLLDEADAMFQAAMQMIRRQPRGIAWLITEASNEVEEEKEPEDECDQV